MIATTVNGAGAAAPTTTANGNKNRTAGKKQTKQQQQQEAGSATLSPYCNGAGQNSNGTGQHNIAMPSINGCSNGITNGHSDSDTSLNNLTGTETVKSLGNNSHSDNSVNNQNTTKQVNGRDASLGGNNSSDNSRKLNGQTVLVNSDVASANPQLNGVAFDATSRQSNPIGGQTNPISGQSIPITGLKMAPNTPSVDASSALSAVAAAMGGAVDTNGHNMAAQLPGLSVASGGIDVAAAMSATTSVADFYRDRNLLITGATGFMGKVLVEKLLRSCPEVGKIFLLMRPRANKDVQTRLQDMINSQLFDNVRSSSPEVLLKLVAVEGDIMLPGLGLSEADTDMLAVEVSVVFHAAATVKFDEAIKLSLQMNVLGVKRMVELCHKMTQLVSLVHVSTAYCNCDRSEVEEQIYPPPSDPYKLLHLLHLMDDDLFNHLTPKLVGNRPNTYTFTKALAEHILVTEAKDLPVAIVRPSIVAAAWREPIPGWVDNLNGPTGLIVGAGKGMLRTLHCHQDLVADLIPVDIPINLLIVTACYTALYRNKSEMLVYNCVSGMERPVRWRDIRDHGMKSLKSTSAMTDVIWYPSLHLSSSRRLNTIGVMLQHWLPAYVMDAVAKLAGKRPFMVRIAEKLDRAAGCLEYFTTHEWKFTSHNVQQLWKTLPEKDKQTFNFNLSNLDWSVYMQHYCLGTKRYVMKEEDSTLVSSRQHLNKLWWVRVVCRVVTALVMWRAAMLRSDTARRVFAALLRLLLRLITHVPGLQRLL